MSVHVVQGCSVQDGYLQRCLALRRSCLLRVLCFCRAPLVRVDEMWRFLYWYQDDLSSTTLILGNQACDLDSMVSAVTLAYHLHTTKPEESLHRVRYSKIGIKDSLSFVWRISSYHWFLSPAKTSPFELKLLISSNAYLSHSRASFFLMTLK